MSMPPEPPPSSGWAIDRRIGVRDIVTWIVLLITAGSFMAAMAADQATTSARIDALERDTGAGSRITAALRELVDQQQARLATLETQQTNTLERIDREYEERQKAQEAIQGTLLTHSASLTSIQANVAAIAAAISGSPGTRP